MNSEIANRTHMAINADHLRRLAVIYVRQSTLEQVRDNTGSAEFQRSLAAVARSYGWTESQIQIIDDDLGKSGSSEEGRTGWQRLQEMVDGDQVGAVFAANMSRLARNLGDFEIFRLRAAYHNTLLYIDGRFLNPADSNDAVVSQITAMVAQFDNRKRAELMMQGRLAKAKGGRVVSRLPLGWIKRPDGQYDYDPAVKETIAMIINTFWQTKSLGRTVRQLSEARITIPYSTHSYRLRYRRITPERVRFILTHPAYGGTYVYGLGRSQAGAAVLPSGKDAETCCITKHDNHPAYMSREQQAEIKAILESSPRRRQRRGRSRALTNHLLRCAVCGEPLEVSHPLKADRFRCRRRAEDTRQLCLNFSSNDLEPCILREVFRVLNAPLIDTLKEEVRTSRKEKQMLVSQIESERERLAREERAAQERIDLTLGSPPRIHFDALEKLEKVLQRKDQFEQKSALLNARVDEEPPAEEELEELCEIATNVPGLWQHELVTDEERKQVLGYLIDHIAISATNERIDATIVWKSGGETSVFVWRPFHRRHLVQELHDQQLTPHEIKEHLAAGKTSTGQSVNLGVARIQTILLRMGLKSARHPASYFLAQRKAEEFHREGRSLQWIAQHFKQLGFASASRRPWTAAMVGYLLYTVGHKSEPLDELHYRLISEACSRGLSYRQIAAAFNKRKIRRLGVVQTWTARNVKKRSMILKKRTAELEESAPVEREMPRPSCEESA